MFIQIHAEANNKNMHRSDCGLQFTSSTPILTPKECFSEDRERASDYCLIDTEMKKFIKICKAILPRFFSSSTLALVILLVTNCVFSYVCKFEVTCNQALHMRL